MAINGLITLLRLIWHETGLHLVPFQSVKCNYNQNVVQADKIQKAFYLHNRNAFLLPFQLKGMRLCWQFPSVDNQKGIASTIIFEKERSCISLHILIFKYIFILKSQFSKSIQLYLKKKVFSYFALWSIQVHNIN